MAYSFGWSMVHQRHNPWSIQVLFFKRYIPPANKSLRYSPLQDQEETYNPLLFSHARRRCYRLLWSHREFFSFCYILQLWMQITTNRTQISEPFVRAQNIQIVQPYLILLFGLLRDAVHVPLRTINILLGMTPFRLLQVTADLYNAAPKTQPV